MEDGIWGESLPMSSAEEALLRDASILGKMKSPKEASVAKALPKNLPWEEKERLIEANVRKRLGRHEADTAVIRDVGEYEAYMRKAIASGSVAVDTETNNSLDPITCKLMGLCLFYEGGKQAYVPVNHVDPKTGKRLSGQLDEAQLKPMLDELQSSKAEIVYHNASFDMRVIQCQVGTALRCDWDTMVASQLLDENEPASLKAQYMLHIDPTHGKYDIESLFEHEEYAKFNPGLFALYAATDAMMTLRLREWQGREFAKPGNEGLLDCYRKIELPVIPVVKDMELRGVCVDTGFVERLTKKYHRILDEYQPKIDAELAKLKPTIDAWKASDEGKSPASGAKGKTKADQLSDPVNIESPSQLSILVYDILKVPPLEKGKRSVDKNTIPLLLEKNDIPLLEVVAERKKFKTLVQNFIDKLPKMINPKTGRMHCSYNQVGTATGRFSCIAEGELVSTGRGDVPIEEISPGDLVYCRDENSGHICMRRVLATHNNGVRECIRIKGSSPEGHVSLTCTPDHRLLFYGKGHAKLPAFAEASSAAIGSILMGLRGNVEVESLEHCGMRAVYDLTVEEFHNFFVNRVCVHNCSDPNL